MSPNSKETRGRINKILVERLHLVGESPQFLQAVDQCLAISQNDITVLFLGETGTGKELFSRWVHQLSPRASGPFVPVDCASIPETLFAHELFGHEKGAFTDAREENKGLLAEALGGTLFLDEVESLPVGAQGTLLRLLENRTWRPLGSTTSQALNCRVIAASN
ncbi:MAG TPA: sigma-54 factor interaction domain-containing protein [Nitrospiria bacterium]|jgi:transcriptional regulator with PAS, ATPase and Fis domain